MQLPLHQTLSGCCSICSTGGAFVEAFRCQMGMEGVPLVSSQDPLLLQLPYDQQPYSLLPHCCCFFCCNYAGGALAEVLRRQLGRDDVPFSIASDSTPWLGKRSFKSFSQAAQEGAISRLYGGVHFPVSWARSLDNYLMMCCELMYMTST
jgi:hypothetical protein